MVDNILITITLFSGLLVVYHHLGYPLILHSVRKRHPKSEIAIDPRHYTYSERDENLPTISIVIPAFNEQKWIADKIRNLATLDYPSNRFEVIIACDGCTDDTAMVAARTFEDVECRHLKFSLHEFKQNRGKVAVVNNMLQDARSELIVLSDVSALVSVDALLLVAEHFRNPEIGVLNSYYRLLNPGSAGEAVYWSYQSQLKASEAALGSTLGAHGAFYAIRRSLFRPLAPDTINDDFILPMEIVAKGYRAEHEHRITALELELADGAMDQQRRRRIAAGNLQQLLRLKHLLSPRHGKVAFAFASGKGLRVMMPFLMIIMLLGSLILAMDYPLFAVAAAGQVLIYTLAGWHMLVKPPRAHRLVQAISYLVSGHMAGLVGSIRYLLGLERGNWKRVDPNIS